jgi:hypothetical protein
MPDAGLPEGGKTGRNSPQTRNAVKEPWGELLERKPYPYTIPLVAKPTGLDGTYVKKAQKEGPIVPCRRCPDWMPYPGIWKLNLNPCQSHQTCPFFKNHHGTPNICST